MVRLVFSIPIELFNTLENDILELGLSRSQYYARRLLFGTYCDGCKHFREITKKCAEFAKANPKMMKTVCISVNETIHQQIMDSAGDMRNLSRYCNALLTGMECKHKGEETDCNNIMSSFTVNGCVLDRNKTDEDWKKESDVRKGLNEIVESANNTYAEMKQRETAEHVSVDVQNEVDYVFGGKPIRPESKQDKVNNDED